MVASNSFWLYLFGMFLIISVVRPSCPALSFARSMTYCDLSSSERSDRRRRCRNVWPPPSSSEPWLPDVPELPPPPPRPRRPPPPPPPAPDGVLAPDPGLRLPDVVPVERIPGSGAFEKDGGICPRLGIPGICPPNPPPAMCIPWCIPGCGGNEPDAPGVAKFEQPNGVETGAPLKPPAPRPPVGAYGFELGGYAPPAPP